jgi:hypothetical protein
MWIELARIVHGKDASSEALALLNTVQSAVNEGRWVLPLSSVHYVELSRVSNVDRRERLGAVMFDLSRGITLAPTRQIIEHEVEVALGRRWPNVEVRSFQLLGFGVGHAFGIELPASWHGPNGVRLERAVLAGDAQWAVSSPGYRGTEFRENFQKHLEAMRGTRTLPRTSWEDALCAISMIDILDPLNRMAVHHGFDKSLLTALGKAGLAEWLQEMPSRRVDMHLHRQVLKDPTYRPKASDLEDWAALGMACAYCDVVACEKHMAAMLNRDHFRERARVERRLVDAVRWLAFVDPGASRE